MKVRRIAVIAAAGVITGGFFAGKLGLKVAMVAGKAVIKSPVVTAKGIKSFASEVSKELRTEKVTERSLVVNK